MGTSDLLPPSVGEGGDGKRAEEWGKGREHLANRRFRLARYTGLFAGVLVATYITLEAPLSGMSMNPARTFSSALAAQLWSWLWIYFIAPPLGMLAAAEVYRWQRGLQTVIGAKLYHSTTKRCIFRCGYGANAPEKPTQEASHARH